MKISLPHKSLLPLLVLATLTQTISTKGPVYPQLTGLLEFNTKSPSVQIQTDMGQFTSTKKYSVWGWFRAKEFYNFNTSSNIIAIQNVQNYDSVELEIGPFPNPDFPTCAYTPAQLEANPELKKIPEIENNPNCFPMKIEDPSQLGTQLGTYSISRDELLFVNYKITKFDPADSSKNRFELHFLVKNKRPVDAADMVMKTFQIPNLPLSQSNWTFFAVCADYEKGRVLLYAKIFGVEGSEFLGDEKLAYPDFALNQGALLLIGAVHKNKYFKSVTGFMGEIAYFQMSPTFLPDPSKLWISEMLPDMYSSRGLNSDLFFNVYDSKAKSFRSSGLNIQDVNLQGNFKPIYQSDKNLTGITFHSGSSFTMGPSEFRGSPFVSSHIFFFEFTFKEPLPEKFPLLFKNEKDAIGFLGFYMVKSKGLTSNGKRVLLIEARGSNKILEWESLPFLEQNKPLQFLAGMVVSPRRSVQALLFYNDQLKVSEALNDFDNYDFSIKSITGTPDTTSSFSGEVTFNRLSVLDNFSGAVFSEMKSIDASFPYGIENCQLHSDYFAPSFGCLKCENSVLVQKQNKCQSHCPKQHRNNGTGVCIPCDQQDCKDLPPLTWKVTKMTEDKYRLTPSRAILPIGTDINKLVNLEVGSLQKNKDYSYSLNPGADNKYVDVNFDFKKSIFNQQVEFAMSPDSDSPLFDANRNLLSSRSSVLFKLPSNCFLDSQIKKHITNLAIAVFFITLACIIIGLILLMFCSYKPSLESEAKQTFLNTPRNSISKFLVHNWMKLQFVAFLGLVSTPIPCCLRPFFDRLYRYAVLWANALSPVWDSLHSGNAAYTSKVYPPDFPAIFKERKVAMPILHNMGVAFIFHLVVFLVFVVFKVADCLITDTNKTFYSCFILVQYSLVIIGYMLFHMMSSVFPFINFSFLSLANPYFIICLIISILYVLGKG